MGNCIRHHMANISTDVVTVYVHIFAVKIRVKDNHC